MADPAENGGDYVRKDKERVRVRAREVSENRQEFLDLLHNI